MIINGDCGMFNPKIIECFKNLREQFENFSTDKNTLDNQISEYFNIS